MGSPGLLLKWTFSSKASTFPHLFSGIYAYVTLMDGVESDSETDSEALKKSLVGGVRETIGA